MAKTYHNLSPTTLGSQFSWCFLALRPFFLGHRSSQDSTTSAMMHRTAPVPCAAETPGGAPRDRRWPSHRALEPSLQRVAVGQWHPAVYSYQKYLRYHPDIVKMAIIKYQIERYHPDIIQIFKDQLPFQSRLTPWALFLKDKWLNANV